MALTAAGLCPHKAVDPQMEAASFDSDFELLLAVCISHARIFHDRESWKQDDEQSPCRSL